MKGKPNLKYSLKPVADYVSQIIPPHVHFSRDVIGPSVEAASKALPDGGVLQLHEGQTALPSCFCKSGRLSCNLFLI
jgi:3-phosphoglycerate kinase